MFVVYNTDTTQRDTKIYQLYVNANRVAGSRNHKDNTPGKWLAVHYDFWREYVVYWKRVRNLMNPGAEVWEPSDTPYYLSVSSETYWSS
jgi:hypothetical protein